MNVIELIPHDGYITAKRLSQITGKEEATIRKCINEARTNGIPICSTTKGYYLSENETDILNTIHFLERRIQTQRQAVEGLRKRVTKNE